MSHLPNKLFELLSQNDFCSRDTQVKIDMPESSMVDEQVTVNITNTNDKLGRFSDGSSLFFVSFLQDQSENIYYSLSFYHLQNTSLNLSFCNAISSEQFLSSLSTNSTQSQSTKSIEISEKLLYKSETYTGIEKMGFIWSMKPIPGSRFGLRYGHKDVTKPMTIKTMVGLCYKSSSSNSIIFEYLASKITNRWYFNENKTNRKEIETKNGVIGTLFEPKKPGKYRAVIDLFGTAGGIIEFRAALFGSHDFVCLSLPYFGYKNLPDTFWGLKAEYFEVFYLNFFIFIGFFNLFFV